LNTEECIVAAAIADASAEHLFVDWSLRGPGILATKANQAEPVNQFARSITWYPGLGELIDSSRVSAPSFHDATVQTGVTEYREQVGTRVTAIADEPVPPNLDSAWCGIR
jgi:hypothetical protein